LAGTNDGRGEGGQPEGRELQVRPRSSQNPARREGIGGL
jgi:hypothetical protein